MYSKPIYAQARSHKNAGILILGIAGLDLVKCTEWSYSKALAFCLWAVICHYLSLNTTLPQRSKHYSQLVLANPHSLSSLLSPRPLNMSKAKS